MALSQMMQHWLSVKEKYKDCLIFYRLGDFYEMFFEDAVKASKILDLTLTGRDCGLEERAPMCGVPHHAVDVYIQKLVSVGEKVAICEQLEDPATAKGIVERGVVRVVTAGTLNADSIDEKTNNYICCAYKNQNGIALSWADITTGDLSVTEFFGDDCIKKCIAQMTKLDVKEVMANDDMLLSVRDLPEITRGILPHFSNFPDWAFGYSAAERLLLEQFNTKTLSAYSVAGKCDAISATGALLEYLKETQMHALKNVNGVKYIENERFMQLDSTAVRNLEIVKTLGDGGKYGSLLWLLDKTCTAMGARLLRSSVLSPYFDKAAINYRLDGVEELFDSTVIRLSVTDLLKEVKDIERIAGKIANGSVLPRDCLALSRSLSVIPNLKFSLSGFNSAVIKDVCAGLLDMSDIAALIDNAISANPPANMKDGGYIKEGYNVRLDELRNIRKNGSKVLLEMEARERDITGIRNLRINYNRIFGYYIEVTKSFIDKVPLSYQRKQTLANSERFITDELKELEVKIMSSVDTAIKMEIEIYEKIKGILAENIESFKSIAESIANLDIIAAFAEIAKTNRYVRPEIAESNQPLIIKEGRHPVVEVISKERFIPNDALLDEAENRTMIITGPNMAGKSTYMRQTAIIAIMAHIGCFVPAKSAKIPLIDRVFTRVGASDNLISDQSTFMVEMIEVATIIQNATKNSLLILDEVGRGTSTYDGLSIAWAVIEHLTEKIGAKTLFATHYHELTELESKMSGVKNYKISVRELNGSVVFLRKIMRGGANRSFGIEVASLAGIPSSVTGRAKEILKAVESGDKSRTAPTVEAEPADVVALTEIERIIMDTDLDNLSPMHKYFVDGRLVLQSYGGGSAEALAQIYGAKVLAQCYTLDAEKDGIKIRGFIGNQNFFKANKTYQSLFLNGRYIVNNTVATAISQAYASYTMKRQFPFYVLFIDVPADIVDVNVHPSKADVRFVDNKFIFGVVYSVISSILDGTARAAEFVVNGNEAPSPSESVSSGAGEAVKNAQTDSYVQANGGEAELQRLIEKYKPQKAIKTSFNEPEQAENFRGAAEHSAPAIEEKPRFFNPTLDLTIDDFATVDKRSVMSVSDNTVPPDFSKSAAYEIESGYFAAKQQKIEFESCKYKGNFFNTYLIYEYGDNAYLIDQHAAHERLIYDSLRKKLAQRSVARQLLLVPYIFETNPSETPFIEGKIPLLRSMGFGISPFGTGAFRIDEVPVDLQEIDIKNFFAEILENIDGLKEIKLEDILKEKIAMTACKHAIKGGMQLTESEIEALFKMLDGDTGLKCPHGRPICVTLSKRDIEKMFKRIV